MSLKISLCFGKVGKHYFAFSNLCANINRWIISLFLWGGGCVWFFLLVEVQWYRETNWFAQSLAVTQLGRSLNGTTEVPFCFSALSVCCIASTGPHKFEDGEVQCRVCNCSVHLTVSSQERSRAVAIRPFLCLGPLFNRFISRNTLQLKVYLGSRWNGTSSSERSLQRESE